MSDTRRKLSCEVFLEEAAQIDVNDPALQPDIDVPVDPEFLKTLPILEDVRIRQLVMLAKRYRIEAKAKIEALQEVPVPKRGKKRQEEFRKRDREIQALINKKTAVSTLAIIEMCELYEDIALSLASGLQVFVTKDWRMVAIDTFNDFDQMDVVGDDKQNAPSSGTLQ